MGRSATSLDALVAGAGCAAGDATGRTTEPVLALAGETMLVTYRDSNGLPMLAWTTTDSPDGWQIIRTRNITCTALFAASGATLAAHCSLLDLGGMPAGAATLQIEAVLHDQFGQTAMPLTQATFSATRQVVWTEAWTTATVCISLNQR